MLDYYKNDFFKRVGHEKDNSTKLTFKKLVERMGTLSDKQTIAFFDQFFLIAGKPFFLATDNINEIIVLGPDIKIVGVKWALIFG